jgi:serine/threonine protein phosphatase PrpC
MTAGKHSGLTDVGRKRKHNEDSLFVAPPLFAVADGMGGANAGEVASGLAVEALREGYESGGDDNIVSLIHEANRRVFQRATEDVAASGMGTTIVVARVEDGMVRLAHVGDSRAYLFREGELTQLTEDHSLVGELVRSGKLSPDEAEKHPQRSVITRALGTDSDVDVDVDEVESKSGDLFLLCSDGLYSMVGTSKLHELIDRNRGDLDKLTTALIAAANRGGGDDNITVVAFEIAAPGEETVRLPAARPAAEAEEREEAEPEVEEDTLDEADSVPAFSTMVIRPEDIEKQFAASQAAAAAAAAEPDEEEDVFAAEEAGTRRRRLLAIVLLLVLVGAAVVVVLYALGVL